MDETARAEIRRINAGLNKWMCGMLGAKPKRKRKPAKWREAIRRNNARVWLNHHEPGTLPKSLEPPYFDGQD